MTDYIKTCLGNCGKSRNFTETDSANDPSLPSKVFVCNNCLRKSALQRYINNLHKEGQIIFDYTNNKIQ